MSSISGTGGYSTSLDRQTFGAQVVSETLDTLNNASSQSMAPVDKQTFGAQVVSKTLDYMNSGNNYGPNNSQDYNFQKSVLDATYSGKGTIIDNLI